MTTKTFMGDEITFDEWMGFMKKRPKDILFEDYMFPNESIKQTFIEEIHSYAEEDVRRILESFLRFDGLLRGDRISMQMLAKLMKDDKNKARKLMRESSYHRSLYRVIQSNGKEPLYDSIMWSLDLLPHSPRDTLNVIGAFSMAHIVHLPDGRIYGLSDAETIIRARYFGAKTDESVLYSLTPAEFEHVVEALYREMGYATKMTKATHDGGRDVIADKDVPGGKEHLVISCKRLRENVEPTDYREIMAVVEDEKATKGVVVTTSGFSTEAYAFANRNPRLELINQQDLQKMLNEYFGANWRVTIAWRIRTSQQRHPKANRV